MLQVANDPSFEITPEGFESAETFDTGTLTYGMGIRIRRISTHYLILL